MKTMMLKLTQKVIVGLGLLMFLNSGSYAVAAMRTDGENSSKKELSQKQSASKQHQAEIRNMKIAFFTDALKLTLEESQAFWPVYNQYWSELREIGKQRHVVHKTIREGQASQKQLDELLNVMDRERSVVAEYMKRFGEILPESKVARVFVTDEDFKRFLIRRATKMATPKSGAH